MDWCRQAKAITWANVDLDPCRHMTSLGHNEIKDYMADISSFYSLLNSI